MNTLEHYRVCFRTPAGGCAAPQGHFRSREEAKRWAGKRDAWIVWEPVPDVVKVKWTVKERKS